MWHHALAVLVELTCLRSREPSATNTGLSHAKQHTTQGSWRSLLAGNNIDETHPSNSTMHQVHGPHLINAHYISFIQWQRTCVNVHKLRWCHYFYHRCYDAILWIYKELSLCEVLYNKLIDCVFLVPSSAVSRHGRTRVILSNLHCT